MSIRRKIAIRADASPEIGSGHLMRCLALSEALAAQGAEMHFLCCAIPDVQVDMMKDRGHHLHRLTYERFISEEDDRAECEAILAGIGPVSWLVVDHYKLGERWESGLRFQAEHILVIDDLADRTHACDLLLDQNLSDDPESRYDSLVSETTRRLLGPRYALLRSEFSQKIGSMRKRDGSVRGLFVFFGGVDSTNETAKTLRAITELGRTDLFTNVVIGPMNPHRREIESLCEKLPGCRTHNNPDIVTLMHDADLAIGAGGVTTWERCAVGLPTLAWPVADNQRPGLALLARNGAVYQPADESVQDAADVARHLFALINNPVLLSSMSERAAQVCDGFGAGRVVAAMLGTELVVRPATLNDCRQVYEWRNHPYVRQCSLQPTPIEWDEHERWFKGSLEREDRRLLIGWHDDRAVGVVRFDVLGSDVAEVSIYLDPAQVHKGYGAELLQAGERWFIRQDPQRHRIVARVLPGNKASHRMFERSGYRCEHLSYEKELST